MKPKQIIMLAIQVTLAKIFKRRIPLKVKQYITYRCNLVCPFCRRRAENIPEMTTGQIKDAMKEFKSMGTIFWEFTGGEPLLREDLGELIVFAKDNLNFHLSIATNGVLLAEKLRSSQELKKIDFIQISLDGTRDIHDKIRGKGNFDRVIRALDILKNSNTKVKISTVATKDNLDCANELIGLSKEYNASIAFEPMFIHPQDTVKSAKDFFPDKEIFKIFLKGLLRIKKERGWPLISSFEYLKREIELWPEGLNQIHCYAGQFYCDISSDGYILPCSAKNIPGGRNGLQSGFKKAFFDMDDMSRCNHICSCSGPQELNIVFNMVPMNLCGIFRNYLQKRII